MYCDYFHPLYRYKGMAQQCEQLKEQRDTLAQQLAAATNTERQKVTSSLPPEYSVRFTYTHNGCYGWKTAKRSFR